MQNHQNLSDCPVQTENEQKRVFDITIKNLIQTNKEFFSYANGSDYMETMNHLIQSFIENFDHENTDPQHFNNVMFLANFQTTYLVKMQEHVQNLYLNNSNL